jgi:hypothetical protein
MGGLKGMESCTGKGWGIYKGKFAFAKTKCANFFANYAVRGTMAESDVEGSMGSWTQSRGRSGGEGSSKSSSHLSAPWEGDSQNT